MSVGGAQYNGAAFLYADDGGGADAAIDATGGDARAGGGEANVSYSLSQLLVPPAGDGALNGGAVALSGEVAIVGPYGGGCGSACTAAPDHGRVYVYSGCRTNCSLSQVLSPPSNDATI